MNLHWGGWRLVRQTYGGWRVESRWHSIPLVSCRTEYQRDGWLNVIADQAGPGSDSVAGLIEAFADLGLVGDLKESEIRPLAVVYACRTLTTA